MLWLPLIKKKINNYNGLCIWFDWAIERSQAKFSQKKPVRSSKRLKNWHFHTDKIVMIGTQNQKFAENEIVFREGDEGDCAYLIEYGQVLVYLEKDGVEIPLKILGKGRFSERCP